MKNTALHNEASDSPGMSLEEKEPPTEAGHVRQNALNPESLRDVYTFKKECVVGGEEELQYTVWLRAGNQSFTLDGYHNEEEAEYFRLMLGKAIKVILSEHATKVRRRL